MAKVAKMVRTYFELGSPKYENGKTYPITEETARLIGQGHAEEVEEQAPRAETPRAEDLAAEKKVAGKEKAKDK